MKKTILFIALTTIVYCAYSQQHVNMNTVQNGISPVIVNKGNTVFLTLDSFNTALYDVSIVGRNVYFTTSSTADINTLMGLKTVDKEEISDAKAAANEQGTEMQKVETDPSNSAIKSQMSTVNSECSTYLGHLETLTKFLFDIKAYSDNLLEPSTANLSITTFRQNFAIVYNLTTPPLGPPISVVLNDFNNSYVRLETAYEQAYKQAVLAGAGLADAQEKIKKAQEKLEEAHQEISKQDIFSILSELNSIAGKLRVTPNFMVLSTGIVAKGDLVAFQVATQPKNTVTNSNNWSFAVELPVKGGLKIDYSLGPVLSFGGNARDDQFFTETTADGKFKLGKHDSIKGVTPSLAAMIHAYRRTGKEVAFGGLFGVGAGFQTINDSNFSMFLGGSLVLGREQKIMIGLGLSFLNVKRLKKSEYMVGGEYTTIDLSEVTRKEMRCSPFFSISYNLTNRVEVN